MKKVHNVLLKVFVIGLVAIVVISLIGILTMSRSHVVLQGQIEATEIRISGKLPGRVDTFFVAEGQTVKRGDTLVGISSPEAWAKLQQANAMENVALPLFYQGVSRKKRNQLALEYLDKLGLKDWAHHMPNELSGGQQQRVAIARALAKNPKLLLCDEPTGALDYVTGKSILKLLQDTCRSTGKTVIVITHNTALTAMADRVIRVKSGTILSNEVNPDPTPVELIEW